MELIFRWQGEQKILTSKNCFLADKLRENIQQRRGIANVCLYVCTWGKKRERDRRGERWGGQEGL